MQDYTQLSEFKDALRQAAESITAVRTVFSDASSNSGELCRAIASNTWLILSNSKAGR